FTGSFTGNLLGSASYAVTSSAATSITFIPLSSSFAVSASWSPFVATISSSWSSQSLSSSYAPTLLPNGVVSSSTQAS
ncbi:hypothetical protein, partial [Staphylococcus aureus]